MRTWLFGLCLLFVSASGLGQSTATESQGMQALVTEVRQLRKDLQATNGYALKAQVLFYHLQFQQVAVAQVSGRLSGARGRITDIQRRRVDVVATLKKFEASLDSTEGSPADRKEIEEFIETNKAELEVLATQEQQRHADEMDAEEQLRIEQAKLNELEERVDRLEKALDNNPR